MVLVFGGSWCVRAACVSLSLVAAASALALSVLRFRYARLGCEKAAPFVWY